jgi:hypothetical protein
MKLLKIAVGHGIQNYTCASATANATAIGALAILYDITELYPGTPGTGINATVFSALSSTILNSQELPLNLLNGSAGGEPGKVGGFPEAAFGADPTEPFPNEDEDLDLGGLELPFLGRHYFDINNAPTFDLLQEAKLLAVVAKKDAVNAPGTADKGLLGTGAVAWLRLLDGGKSQGVTAVYRVVTAGGSPQPCSTSGQGAGSVPYAAQYWFYGSA